MSCCGGSNFPGFSNPFGMANNPFSAVNSPFSMFSMPGSGSGSMGMDHLMMLLPLLFGGGMTGQHCSCGGAAGRGGQSALPNSGGGHSTGGGETTVPLDIPGFSGAEVVVGEGGISIRYNGEDMSIMEFLELLLRESETGDQVGVGDHGGGGGHGGGDGGHGGGDGGHGGGDGGHGGGDGGHGGGDGGHGGGDGGHGGGHGGNGHVGDGGNGGTGESAGLFEGSTLETDGNGSATVVDLADGGTAKITTEGAASDLLEDGGDPDGVSSEGSSLTVEFFDENNNPTITTKYEGDAANEVAAAISPNGDGGSTVTVSEAEAASGDSQQAIDAEEETPDEPGSNSRYTETGNDGTSITYTGADADAAATFNLSGLIGQSIDGTSGSGNQGADTSPPGGGGDGRGADGDSPPGTEFAPGDSEIADLGPGQQALLTNPHTTDDITDLRGHQTLRREDGVTYVDFWGSNGNGGVELRGSHTLEKVNTWKQEANAGNASRQNGFEQLGVVGQNWETPANGSGDGRGADGDSPPGTEFAPGDSEIADLGPGQQALLTNPHTTDDITDLRGHQTLRREDGVTYVDFWGSNGNGGVKLLGSHTLEQVNTWKQEANAGNASRQNGFEQLGVVGQNWNVPAVGGPTDAQVRGGGQDSRDPVTAPGAQHNREGDSFVSSEIKRHDGGTRTDPSDDTYTVTTTRAFDTETEANQFAGQSDGQTNVTAGPNGTWLLTETKTGFESYEAASTYVGTVRQSVTGASGDTTPPDSGIPFTTTTEARQGNVDGDIEGEWAPFRPDEAAAFDSGSRDSLGDYVVGSSTQYNSRGGYYETTTVRAFDTAAEAHYFAQQSGDPNALVRFNGVTQMYEVMTTDRGQATASGAAAVQGGAAETTGSATFPAEQPEGTVLMTRRNNPDGPAHGGATYYAFVPVSEQGRFENSGWSVVTDPVAAAAHMDDGGYVPKTMTSGGVELTVFLDSEGLDHYEDAGANQSGIVPDQDNSHGEDDDDGGDDDNTF